jgi:hypothetical protein
MKLVQNTSQYAIFNNNFLFEIIGTSTVFQVKKKKNQSLKKNEI